MTPLGWFSAVVLSLLSFGVTVFGIAMVGSPFWPVGWSLVVLGSGYLYCMWRFILGEIWND